MKALLILSLRAFHGLFVRSRRVVLPIVYYGCTLQIDRELPGIIRLFEEAKIPYWLGGGIAYDALRGYRTRPHKDLDVSVLEEDLPRTRELFESAGFKFRHSGKSCYIANRRGLRIDLFSWRKSGEYREQVYNEFCVRIQEQLFKEVVYCQIGNQQVRLATSTMMHVWLPLVKNPRDREFIEQMPVANGYRVVNDDQEIRMVMNCYRLEPIENNGRALAESNGCMTEAGH